MIRVRKEIQGWTDYLLWFRNLAYSSPETFTYVEVGAKRGQSLLALADCLHEYGKSGHLVAIAPDRAEHEEGGFEIEVNLMLAKTTTAITTAIEWDNPLAVANRWAAESGDVVFLDAATKYDSLMDEIVAWWGKVKLGGILAGHDYLSPQWVDVAPTVDLWAEELGLTVHHEAPQVWWVEKPGGPRWFRKAFWHVDVRIPHEHATNPSVCRDPQSGTLVYVFRTSSFGWGHGRLWIGELDESTMTLKRRPHLLRLGPEELNYEDPRLFILNNQLWLSATVTDFSHPLTNRMGIAPLKYTVRGRWDIDQPVQIFDSPKGKNQEKNWIFFGVEGELRSVYSMDPWIIQSHGKIPTDGTPCCLAPGLKWDFGHVRGGSQFFPVSKQKWWAFFHSSRNSRYYAGLVEVDAISGRPTRMTKEPLFLDEEVLNSWVGYPVLWVAGASVIGDEVLVAYGHNDQTCHLRLVSIAELDVLLKPIGP